MFGMKRTWFVAAGAMLCVGLLPGAASAQSPLVGDGAVAAACRPWMQDGTEAAVTLSSDGTYGGYYAEIDATGTYYLNCPLQLEDGQWYDTVRLWAQDSVASSGYVRAIVYQVDRTTGATTKPQVEDGQTWCDLSTSTSGFQEYTDGCVFYSDTGRYSYYALITLYRSVTTDELRFYSVMMTFTFG